MTMLRTVPFLCAWLVLHSLSVGAADVQPTATPPRLDAEGDPLPKFVRVRLGSTRWIHGAGITNLRFSPDGKTLFSSGRDRFVRRWETANGKEFGQVSLPESGRDGDGRSFLAPDGRTLAVIDGATVRVWELATGNQPARQIGTVSHDGSGFVAFAPDSKSMAAMVEEGDRTVIRQWSVTGTKVRDYALPAAKKRRGDGLLARSLFFSGDGKVIGALEDMGDRAGLISNVYTPRLWDVATGNLLPAFDKLSLIDAAVTPDGKRLIGITTATTLDMWELATGKPLGRLGRLRFEHHHLATYRGTAFVFSADSRRLAIQHSCIAARPDELPVEVWDLEREKEVVLPQLDKGNRIVTVAFSADGKQLALGTSTGSVWLCEAPSGNSLHEWKGCKPIRRENHHEFQPFDGTLAFAPNGRSVAMAGAGGRIRLWDVTTGKELFPTTANGEVLAVACSPDGKRLAVAGNEGSVLIHDAGNGRLLHRITGPADDGRDTKRPNAAFSLAFSPDNGQLATGWRDGAIQLWDVATGKEVRTFDDPNRSPSPVGSLALSPDGRRLASGDWTGRVMWWDQATGKPIQEMNSAPDHGGPQKLAISADGRTLAAVHRRGPVRNISIWELTTGKLRRSIAVRSPGQALSEPDIGFADGYFLERAGYGAVNGIVYSDFDPFGGVAFSPDGKTLAWTSGCLVRLWDHLVGKEVRQLGGPEATIHGIAYSPDGKLIAAASSDGIVHVWQAANGDVAARLRGHRGGVRCLAFVGNGELATGSADGTMLLWDVAGAVTAAQRRPHFSDKELAELWEQAAGEDANRSAEAMNRLVGSPEQAVPLIREKVRPIPVAIGARIKKLLDDLDSEKFEVRDRATAELTKLGSIAEPYLRKRAESKPPLEALQRLEGMLEKLAQPFDPPDVVTPLRAIEVLERIGTPEARGVLRELASGAAEARLTREAQAALKRLGEMK